VIVPEIVPASDQNRLRRAAKGCPDERLEMGSGFSLNQAFRQTAALEAFARLSC
jgi:hypothetical protein